MLERQSHGETPAKPRALFRKEQQFPEAYKSKHSSGIPPCLFVNRHVKMWHL
jgi:hypothetical protein